MKYFRSFVALLLSVFLVGALPYSPKNLRIVVEDEEPVMALSFVGGATNSAASGTAVSVTHGLTINSGDLVWAIVHNNGSHTCVDNNGAYSFTEVDDQYMSLPSSSKAHYWRIAGASEPSSYAWTISGSNRWAVAVLVFRPTSGTIQSPPYDVAPGSFSGDTSDSPLAAAETGSVSDVTWVAVAYVDGAETFSATPTGYTQGAQIETDQPISAYYKLTQASGSTGTAAWTLAASQQWGAEIFILLPPAGGAYTLDAGAGSYTLSGTAAGVLKDSVLGAGAGSYSLSGQAASLLKGYHIDAAIGSYSLSGQDLMFIRDLVISAANGSYVLSGQDVGLLFGFVLTAAAGSYNLSGQDIALARGLLIEALSGSYALTGADAGLTYTPAALVVGKPSILELLPLLRQ